MELRPGQVWSRLVLPDHEPDMQLSMKQTQWGFPGTGIPVSSGARHDHHHFDVVRGCSLSLGLVFGATGCSIHP